MGATTSMSSLCVWHMEDWEGHGQHSGKLGREQKGEHQISLGEQGKRQKAKHRIH